jgi:hypothetical protein
MTQEEKAKELFDKFYSAIPNDEMGENYNSAKQCALIAVDFALSQLEVKIRPPRLDIQIVLNEQNLNKLKQEIEKL